MFPLLVFIIASITHLFSYGNPPSVVFDEVFYGNFIQHYWQGTYFFDQHPPFVKLLFTFVGWIFGANHYQADWTSIGNVVPAAIIDIRIVPMIAGILLSLVIYALCRRLEFSKTASITAAILVSLENSLIVQSRFLLPDVILLLAGFSAILCYLEYIRRFPEKNRRWFLLASSVLAALALSTKWTGLTFLFMIVCLEFYRLFKNRTSFGNFAKKLSSFVAIYAGISLVIYLTLFAVHFALLPKSGPGDAFMTPSFLKTLSNSQYSADPIVAPEGFFGKFLELNREMYVTNKGMTATHPYSSKWYTWPFMIRPVFYWQGNTGSSTQPQSYIYLLGNPFIYWLGSLSILTVIILGIIGFINIRSGKENSKEKIIFFLSIGYLANLLPFALIGRVMFLYHYETALVFSIIAISFLTDYFDERKRNIITGIILLVALIAFIYWSPLTYGTPLSDQQLASLMWLRTWR